MGLLDVYAAQAGPASSPLIQPPSTPGERFTTERAAADAPDNWWNLTGSRRDEHQKVVDALHTATGESFANPYGPVTPEEMMRLGNQPAIVEERKQKIRDARNVLQQDAGVGDVIPDPDAVDRQIGEQGEALRGKAASLVNTGNGLAAFAGGATALTPVNVAGLLIPPSRAVFGATTVARGFLAGLGREAAYQGVTQGALTAASEGLDVIARSETGTAPTFGEAVGNVAMGTAAGAVLGGAFHVLHAGPKALWERWNRLPEPVKENAPLEVRDAMKVLETDTIYGEANRLGLPWAMHEKYQNAAADPILRGRGVRLEDLKPVDTPMTALGTILRMAPDAVDARADLPLAAGRVAALPDAELEPFVRQMKPGSFKALDDVNTRIKTLDQRAEAIQREADQIGVTDVADPDTAAILRDIEEKLQQPGLRAATREQLLHERAQWIETLDVHGGLTEALKQGRRDVFPEHLPQLREIAAERAKLQKELTIAQGEAQREVDFLRGKLDKIETGRPEAPRRSEPKIDVVQSAGGKVEFRLGEDEGQGIIGYVKDGAFTVKATGINENMQGKGHGVSLYKRAIKWADEHGLEFHSDAHVTGEAVRVYESLARRGYDVQRQPGVESDGPALFRSNGDGITVGKEPVFTVKSPTATTLEGVSRETFGADPADVAKGLEAAEFDRMIRTVRENVPGGERPAAAPAREPAPKPTADGLAPEQVQAIKTAADAVMEGKSGALSDFKRAVKREMDGLDLELNDARSAAACVANGGGIP